MALLSTNTTTTVTDIADVTGDRTTIDAEQAAHLQHLAKSYNGQHGNSAAPAASNPYHDIDDPKELMEQLANFGKPSHAPNNQFESLVQAAVTAGGAEAAEANGNTTDSQAPSASPNTQSQLHSPGPFQSSTRATPARRRRKSRNEVPQRGLIGSGPNNKRRRQDSSDGEDEDDLNQLNMEEEIWGPQDEENGSPSNFEYQTTAAEVAEDARTAGVHSAAALFRRPSAASKKYTRPPMSKLFTSLELTPEQFLHLQAAAKSYMLDEQHPERGDCVGKRERGDNDMIKLKLFGCVKAFLEDEGWGERCFGRDAPGAATRKLKYPEMKNKIISLLTPLLRRMVTNERQRLYAIEMRKQSQAKANLMRITPHTQPQFIGQPGQFMPSQYSQTQLSPPPPSQSHSRELTPSQQRTQSPVVDLESSQNYQPELDPNFTGYDIEGRSRYDKQDARLTFREEAFARAEIRYHVNLLQHGKKVKSKLKLTEVSCPGFPSLVQYIQNFASDEGLPRPNSIRFLGLNGLVPITSQEDWLAAIAQVRENDWMDGDLRIIARIDTTE
ncbi:hypothetical protein PVAG01_01613 [Phlyctema vagabunda]|uniref:Uncharacterized protein n=1 Tax=Phlyctema vagabunda TaxID=108571 RepID=A0ABR4PXK1_9HELO